MGVTRIPYLDRVWNPVIGCSPAMACARQCWAPRAVARLAANPKLSAEAREAAGAVVVPKMGTVPRSAQGAVQSPFSMSRAMWTGKCRLVERWMDAPLHWGNSKRRTLSAERRALRVGVCYLGDLFAKAVPEEWQDRVFSVMARAHWHRFVLLTKRVERMSRYLAGLEPRLPEAVDRVACEWPLPNVWLGVSVAEQRDMGRVLDLVNAPAALRVVSYEPAIGPVSVYEYLQASRTEGVGWVIVGCESGPGRRPMRLEWARAVVEQCREAGVPCFVKQLDAGKRVMYPGDREWPEWAGQETPSAERRAPNGGCG